MFKSLAPSGEISFGHDEEIYKQNGVNNYSRTDLKYEEDDQLVLPGTINQIEIFHKWIISDLFKRNKDINFEKCNSEENQANTKKYYIIPLKIKKGQEDVEMNNE